MVTHACNLRIVLSFACETKRMIALLVHISNTK